MADTPVSPDLAHELQSILYSCVQQGQSIGPVWFQLLASQEQRDNHEDAAVLEGLACDATKEITVRDFFRLSSRRGLFEPNVASLVHHYSVGAVSHLLTADQVPEDAEYDVACQQMCGRCEKSKNKVATTVATPITAP
jgi:hypothetical protein